MENLPIENITSKIFTIRDEKVMLDSDLASLYQVETKNLNKAVARNIKRFPNDFMFQLSNEEFENLRFQFGTFNSNLKNRKYMPYVFTENGIAMLSSVLRSDIAIEVNIEIMRTFTKLRKFTLDYSDITSRLDEIEKTIKIDQQYANYNADRIDEAFKILNQILKETEKTSKNLIGFRPKVKNK